MRLETGRVVLIRYTAPGGTRCVGSGLLIDERWVLTADHVAEGSGHRVECDRGTAPVAEVVRSGTPEVDLAVLRVGEPFAGLVRLGCARVDRSRVDRVSGCTAVGFPRWRKDRDLRRSAQVEGWLPTAEGLESTADAGLRAGWLTLVGDRIPGAPEIPLGTLSETAPGPWGGMSGAVVVAGDLVVGVVRSHNLAAGGQSLTVTPVTAVDKLPGETGEKFRDALGIQDPGLLPVLPDTAEIPPVRPDAPGRADIEAAARDLYAAGHDISITNNYFQGPPASPRDASRAGIAEKSGVRVAEDGARPARRPRRRLLTITLACALLVITGVVSFVLTRSPGFPLRVTGVPTVGYFLPGGDTSNAPGWHDTSTFTPGEPLEYTVGVHNSGTAAVAAAFHWVVTGPRPASSTDISQTDTVKVPAGTSGWFLPGQDIPNEAPEGTYTITVTVSLNGRSSSDSTDFIVTGTPRTLGTGLVTSNPYNNSAELGQSTYGADQLFASFTKPLYRTSRKYLPNFGNAGSWSAAARKDGWTVSATPQPNSIAVFQPGVDGIDAGAGRVAWVTDVSQDKSNITVDEMNGGVGTGRFDYATYSTGPGITYILVTDTARNTWSQF